MKKSTKKVIKAGRAAQEIVETTVPAPVQLQAKSVNAIMGFALSRYKTEDAEEYQAQLRVMNKFDLQIECIRVELAPKDNRETMIERLMKQFRIHTAGNQAPPKPVVIKVNQNTKNILSALGTSLV